LARARETYFTALLDGRGRNQSANEYLKAHDQVWRRGIIYDRPDDEMAIWRLAKADEEDPYAAIDWGAPIQGDTIPDAYGAAAPFDHSDDDDDDVVDEYHNIHTPEGGDDGPFGSGTAQALAGKRADAVTDDFRVTAPKQNTPPKRVYGEDAGQVPNYPGRGRVMAVDPRETGRVWAKMHNAEDPEDAYRDADLLFRENPKHELSPLKVGNKAVMAPQVIHRMIEFLTDESEESPGKTHAEDHHDAIMAMYNHAKAHPENPFAKHHYIGPINPDATTHSLYERSYGKWLRGEMESGGLLHGLGNVDLGKYEKSLRDVHLLGLVQGWLSDDVNTDKEGNHHRVGVGDGDFDLGLMLLTPEERTKVYDHLRENKINDSENYRIKLGDVDINHGNLQANYISRNGAETDWLHRPFDYDQEDQEHFPEYIPEDTATHPTHIFRSLGERAMPLRKMIHLAAGKPLDDNGNIPFKYTVPVYDEKNKEFIIEEKTPRPTHDKDNEINGYEYPPDDNSKWSRSGALMALGVNPDTLNHYEDGEHPVWGERWREPYTDAEYHQRVSRIDPNSEYNEPMHRVHAEGVDGEVHLPIELTKGAQAEAKILYGRMDVGKRLSYQQAHARNSYGVLGNGKLAGNYFDTSHRLLGRRTGLKDFFARTWKGHGGMNLGHAVIRDLQHDKMVNRDETGEPIVSKGNTTSSMFTVKSLEDGHVHHHDGSGIMAAHYSAPEQMVVRSKSGRLSTIEMRPGNIVEQGEIFSESKELSSGGISPVAALGPYNRGHKTVKGGAKNPRTYSHSPVVTNKNLRDIHWGMREEEGVAHSKTKAQQALDYIRGKVSGLLSPHQSNSHRAQEQKGIGRFLRRQIQSSGRLLRRYAQTGQARHHMNPQEDNVVAAKQPMTSPQHPTAIHDPMHLDLLEANIGDLSDKPILDPSKGVLDYEQEASDASDRVKDYESQRSYLQADLDMPSEERFNPRQEARIKDAIKGLDDKIKQFQRAENNAWQNFNQIRFGPMSQKEMFDTIEEIRMLRDGLVGEMGDAIDSGNKEAMGDIQDKLDGLDEREDTFKLGVTRQGLKPHDNLSRQNALSGKKIDADIDAMNQFAQTNVLPKVLEDLGLNTIWDPNDPETSLANAMVIMAATNKSINLVPDAGVSTVGASMGFSDDEVATGGKEQKVVRDTVENHGYHLTADMGMEDIIKKLGLPVTNDSYAIAKRIGIKMASLSNPKGHVFQVMNVKDMLNQRDIGEENHRGYAHSTSGILNHGHHGKVDSAIESLQHELGIHWLHANTQDPKRRTRILGAPLTGSSETESGSKAFLTQQILDSFLIADTLKESKEIPSIENFSTGFGPVKVGKKHGYKVNSHFNSSRMAHDGGTLVRPNIKVFVDHTGQIHASPRTKGYDIRLPTLPMNTIDAVLPEIRPMLGAHHEERREEDRRGRLFRISPGGHSMNMRPIMELSDGPTLLASLTNPDILYKSVDGLPFLQPMHRIFTLDDLEHLRGFTGDWMVTAWPHGGRHFIERKDDKVKSWSAVEGDDDIVTDETKEHLLKISKKDFLIDTVYVGDECHVLDIVEYDGSNVHDLSVIERMKILRGAMESVETVLLPAAHNTRLTDDAGLEDAVKNLSKEHDRLLLRDANSTYMKGETRHPKWVVLEEGSDVNLVILESKGKGPYTYRLGTGPITHVDEIGDRAVEIDGEHYMDVGTVFSSDKKYEKGDLVQVNVDRVSETEQSDGHKLYTVHGGEITEDAEGEGISSVETLSLLSKAEIWPHEVMRDGERVIIKLSAGEVSYRTTLLDEGWAMHSPRANNSYLLRLSESQRPYWAPVVGLMLKADLDMTEDEVKAEVHESKDDGEPLISPKKTKGTDFWADKEYGRVLVKGLTLIENLLKSGVGAVGHASTGAMGLGIDYATPIESPTGPTSLRDHSTMPDYDSRHRPGEDPDKEEEETQHSGAIEHGITALPGGVLVVSEDSATFETH
jgi:hypothetical protein